jgi:aryl-alcohol dehydrogenase-like predicted oxidoreductase
VPLIGARTREQLEDAIAALELELSQAQLERIEAAVPPEAVAGSRYAEAQMAHLDSER